MNFLQWLLLPITATAALSPSSTSTPTVPLLGENTPYVIDYPVTGQDALQARSLQETANMPPETDKTILGRYFTPSVAIKMYQIATCESGNRQFDEGGKVITHTNDNGTTDYGYLQDNSSHEALAQSYDLDYKGSLEDNIHLASIIYAQQGYGAWTCSHGII